jgi:hypothetical protein
VTQIPAEFPLEEAALSDQAEEPVVHIEPRHDAKRPFMFLFRSSGWEPLCPDLMNEVTVGLGRRD